MRSIFLRTASLQTQDRRRFCKPRCTTSSSQTIVVIGIGSEFCWTYVLHVVVDKLPDIVACDWDLSAVVAELECGAHAEELRVKAEGLHTHKTSPFSHSL